MRLATTLNNLLNSSNEFVFLGVSLFSETFLISIRDLQVVIGAP